MLIFEGDRQTDNKTMTMAKPEAESKRKVLLYPGEDSYFVVEVPSLPGCISQGKTREEALANIEEAIALYIEVLQNRGETIPNDMVEVVLV
jgi:predicted RNase H-like HicB family nuclease